MASIADRNGAARRCIANWCRAVKQDGGICMDGNAGLLWEAINSGFGE
jgi:hypothetical protein